MRQDDLIRCYLDGRALVPDGNAATAALHDRLGEGQVVHVDLDPERSAKSHRHQFGFVRVAWDNLPEQLKGAPFAKSADTLRKHALIACGYCETRMVAVGDTRRAERTASVIRESIRALSVYAVVSAEGPVIYIHTPLSQSLKAMGGVRFQESKQAILEWLADLIGVEPDRLAATKRKVAA